MPRNTTSRRHIRQITLFVIPILLLFCAGEWGLRSMPNLYRTKAERLQHMAPRVEILILGASHTLMGISPKQLSSHAFNMAGVSQTLDLDYEILATYLPMLTQLKQVVVCADAGILFDPPLSQGDERFRTTYYNLYFPISRQGTWPRFSFEMGSYTGAKEKLSAFLRGEGCSIDSLGWYTSYTPDKRDAQSFTPQRAAERIAHHYRSGTEHLAQNREELQRLYQLCRQHNVQLLIVSTPTHRFYREAMPKDMAEHCAATLQTYRKLRGVTVLDYSADPRFDDQDFFDLDHLSTIGAVKFSQILSKDAAL